MREGAAEPASAFAAFGLACAASEKPPLSAVMFVAPAASAKALSVYLLRLAADFADAAAERMKTLAGI